MGTLKEKPRRGKQGKKFEEGGDLETASVYQQGDSVHFNNDQS